jgi:hypothetical protein
LPTFTASSPPPLPRRTSDSASKVNC